MESICKIIEVTLLRKYVINEHCVLDMTDMREPNKLTTQLKIIKFVTGIFLILY